MKFILNESFAVGDIIIPKTEYLDPGEVPSPMVVLDIWKDTTLNRYRVSLLSAEEAEQIAAGTLVGFPHSRFDSFADYYKLYDGEDSAEPAADDAI